MPGIGEEFRKGCEDDMISRRLGAAESPVGVVRAPCSLARISTAYSLGRHGLDVVDSKVDEQLSPSRPLSLDPSFSNSTKVQRSRLSGMNEMVVVMLHG